MGSRSESHLRYRYRNLAFSLVSIQLHRRRPRPHDLVALPFAIFSSLCRFGHEWFCFASPALEVTIISEIFPIRRRPPTAFAKPTSLAPSTAESVSLIFGAQLAYLIDYSGTCAPLYLFIYLFIYLFACLSIIPPYYAIPRATRRSTYTGGCTLILFLIFMAAGYRPRSPLFFFPNLLSTLTPRQFSALQLHSSFFLQRAHRITRTPPFSLILIISIIYSCAANG